MGNPCRTTRTVRDGSFGGGWQIGLEAIAGGVPPGYAGGQGASMEVADGRGRGRREPGQSIQAPGSAGRAGSHSQPCRPMCRTHRRSSAARFDIGSRPGSRK